VADGQPLPPNPGRTGQDRSRQEFLPRPSRSRATSSACRARRDGALEVVGRCESARDVLQSSPKISFLSLCQRYIVRLHARRIYVNDRTSVSILNACSNRRTGRDCTASRLSGFRVGLIHKLDQPNSWPSSGRSRIRLPVAAKMAFVTAGMVGGTPGSPIPVGTSFPSIMRTLIFGISDIRTTG